jgi:hypothetical protein
VGKKEAKSHKTIKRVQLSEDRGGIRNKEYLCISLSVYF